MELIKGMRLGPVCGRKEGADAVDGLAHRPPPGHEIRGAVGGAPPVYRETRGAASRILAESVAEIGVNEADCYIRVSNSIPGFLPRSWSGGGYEVGKAEHGCDGAPRDGSASRSVCVLALRCWPGRSCGPGRLTPQVGAGDHSGQDAKPAPHRLLLLGGMRRRPAIVRWSPRQLFPSLRFAATHRIAALAVECAQSQRGIRPLIALRRDAGCDKRSFFWPLPRSIGGVQEFEFRN